MSDVPGAEPRQVLGDPRAWLEANADAVSHVAHRVARSRGLHAQASAALGCAVLAHLAENDYRVLRRYRGEADMKTYLTVVASRVLLERRVEA